MRNVLDKMCTENHLTHTFYFNKDIPKLVLFVG